MIVIQAIDRDGKRWFRSADGSWREKRDSTCHFMTTMTARHIYHSAVTSDRFKSADERMEEIEMVTLT